MDRCPRNRGSTIQRAPAGLLSFFYWTSSTEKRNECFDGTGVVLSPVASPQRIEVKI